MKTPQIKNLIGRVRKNNRAARAARTCAKIEFVILENWVIFAYFSNYVVLHVQHD